MGVAHAGGQRALPAYLIRAAKRRRPCLVWLVKLARAMDLFGLPRLERAIGRAAERKAVPAGGYLFRQGDKVGAVFVVETGRLALVRDAADGRRLMLHVARPGDSLAEAALFATAYHCDALAEIASRVAVLPKSALAMALAREPDLAREVMARLARQVQALRARLELRNVRSARERVLQMLLLAAGGQANTVIFDRPLKDIAAEIGLTHEAFYRALAALEADGAIRRARRRITLAHPAA